MITEAQRQARRQTLGSSDAPAIIGADPFRSISDIYWSKVADLPESAPSAAMEVGNMIESALCEYAARKLSVSIERDVSIRSKVRPYMAANLDARVIGQPVGLEAKYSSAIGEWGEEGTDEVPERVLVQAHHQMFVAEMHTVWVPVMLVLERRAQFRLYKVERNDALLDGLLGAEERFWIDHVEARRPPTDEPAPLAVLKRIARRDVQVELDTEQSARVEEAIESLDSAKAHIRALEAAKDEAQRLILDALGDATGAILADGSRVITYREQKSAPAVDHARFKELAPDVWAQVVKQGTHRVLRIK